ncbi:hypothetical protein EMIT0P4_40266 [Pseudomonas sp. IT-P4]
MTKARLMEFSRYRVWAMVAGIWFHRMSENDLWRVIGPGGVLIFLLLPGFTPGHPSHSPKPMAHR